jgi:hypothetical protein
MRNPHLWCKERFAQEGDFHYRCAKIISSSVAVGTPGFSSMCVSRLLVLLFPAGALARWGGRGSSPPALSDALGRLGFLQQME